MTDPGTPPHESPAAAAWPSLFALAVAAPFAYVASEWLFFATKPSFLNALSLGEQISVLLRVAAWVMAPFALATGLAWAVARAAGPGRLGRAAARAARIAAALVVAALVLLLLDNFLYTLSGWGTPRLEGPARWLGTAVYLGIFALLAPRVGRWQAALERRPRLRRAILLVAALLLAAAGADALRSVRPSRWAAQQASGSATRLNVVLFGGDGISAAHLASFGGPRTTTPFLDRLAAESLLAVNAFSNAASTGASLTSILTSALPSETGVVRPPDIARSPWVYRHLPGILRGLGYVGGQFSIRWFGDAIDLNLRDSFHWANGRAAAQVGRFAPLGRLDADGGYFLDVVAERLLERVVPSAVARQGRDAHREVADKRFGVAGLDVRRMEAVREFVTSARGPFFVHVHLMGTHGPRFHPALRQFSRDRAQRAAFDLDFYDDAIVEFDRRLEELVRFLEQEGELERTLLVVYSDHGMNWDLYERVPLLVRAPRGALAGRIERRPAQLLDIAPTVLDLLGQPIPVWMRGRSLLDPGRDGCPEILAFDHLRRPSSGPGMEFRARTPAPFFALASVALAVGRQSVTLDLTPREVSSRRLDLAGDAGKDCPALEPHAAAARIVTHLAENGYDVSSLRGRLSFSETAAP